jgi:hypothetical protein
MLNAAAAPKAVARPKSAAGPAWAAPARSPAAPLDGVRDRDMTAPAAGRGGAGAASGTQAVVRRTAAAEGDAVLHDEGRQRSRRRATAAATKAASAAKAVEAARRSAVATADQGSAGGAGSGTTFSLMGLVHAVARPFFAALGTPRA